MKRFRWDKKYLYWGVTAFLVIAASIVFYVLVNHLGWLRETLRQFGTILSPFVWGLVIAYLLYPLMKIYQRHIFMPLGRALYKKSPKKDRAVPKFARGFAVVFSIISLLIIVGGMIWLVVPQLYSSVESIIVNSGNYIDKADEWITRLFNDYPEIETALSSLFGDISSGLLSWASNNLLPEIKNLVTNVSSGVYYFAKGIYNILIGMIVSVYMLYSRETFSAHGKKLLYSVFSLEAAEKILDAIHFTNRVFIGFISGKILDSLIIGILCYIGCSILNIEYAVLVSSFVGVTNVIPFFGPLFGAIPTTFIILMESPMHALVFLIFVLLLQQFDGNVLGPKILGSSVGINGFWVMFSILLGAGLFGFAGMLLGVPVFVILYTLFKNLVNRKLVRSGLPEDTASYMELDHFDPKTGAPVGFEHAAKRTDLRKKWHLRDLDPRTWKKKKEEAAQSAAPSGENTEKTEDKAPGAQPAPPEEAGDSAGEEPPQR